MTVAHSQRPDRHVRRLLGGPRRRRLVERLLRGTVLRARSLVMGDAAVDIAVGTGVELAVASSLANIIGAIVVFAICGFLLPAPITVTHPGTVLALNLGVLVVYFPLAVAAAAGAAIKLLRPVLEWVLPGRPPTARQQYRALRYPLLQAEVHGVLWAIAVPIFTGLNAIFSWELALAVGLTVLLGGLSTVAVGYLLVERVWRPVTAAALRDAEPDEPALPGVTVRLVTTWLLATAVPLLGMLLVLIEPIALTQNRLVVVVSVLTAVALLVGLLAQTISARAVAEPLQRVREAIDQVGHGDFDVQITVSDGGEIGLLQSGVNRMVAGLQERERMRELFSRQVGSEVAAEAMTQQPSLGGTQREVAVLFVDVVGSTRLAEREDPSEVVRQLNHFFSCVVQVVGRHGGQVNKFEGDAALCIFGAPVELPDAAAACLCAARTMTNELANLPQGLEAAVGVSAGTVVAGYIGSEDRYEYTVIGDAVNEASRITDLAKKRRPRLLSSAAAVAAAGPDEAGSWEAQASKRLRGRSTATELCAPGTGAMERGCRHAGGRGLRDDDGPVQARA